MTYYDRLKAFFDENEINPLPPSAQLVYLHILHESNRLRDPSFFYITDIRLAFTTGLTRQAITEAKRQLKNAGLIDFRTDKKNPRAGTRYTLLENREKNREKSQETANTIISAELQKTWKANNDGTPPTETETYYLADDVKLYGEDKVRQAIIRAGQKKRGSLSVYFYKMQLGDVTTSRKESAGNARRNTGTDNRTVSQYDRGADICPAD